MPKNTMEIILSLMQLENNDPDTKNDILEITYRGAGSYEKKIMDDIMICICGYSLDTIINNSKSISWKGMQ